MRRLRRIIRLAALGLTAVIALTIALAVTIETAWFKRWLSGRIVRAANENLNATLSIGRLSGNLYSGVEVDDVRVVMNGHPVITIDKVTAVYSIRNMISKGIVVDHVDVTRPVVAMHRDDSGWDLARFIKKKAEEAAHTEGRPITVHRITIADGTFSMARPERATIALESIDANLTLQYRTEHFTFDIARLSLASKDPDIAVQRASGLVELRDEDLQFGAFSVHTRESNLTVNGDVRHFRSAPVFALHVHSDRLSFPEIRRLFPPIGTTKLRPAVDIKLNGQPDRLATDFNLRSPSGEVTAKGVTHIDDEGRSFDGQVSLRGLDLSQFFDNPDWPSDIHSDAIVKLRSTAGAKTFLDGLRGDIDLTGRKIHVREYIVDDVKTKARLDGRTVDLKSFNGLAFGVPTTAAGPVTLPSDERRELGFDVTGHVTDVNLAKLPSWMRAPTAETRLTTAYHVTGVVPLGRPGTQVGGDVTFEPSTAAGVKVDRGATVSFHVGPDDLRYQVDAQVSNVDLQRIGNEFHIQTLATDRYRSVLNGHVTATVRGSDLDTMDLAATGMLVKSSMFSGEFPQVSFDTTIRDGALRVKAQGQIDSVNLAIAADRPSLEGSVTGTVDTDITFADVSNGVRVDSIDAEVTADLEPSSVGAVSIDRGSIAGEYHNAVADVQRLEVAGADITATGNGTLAFSDSGRSGFWIHANAPRLETIGDLVKRPLTGIATVDAVIGGNIRQFVATGNLTAEGVKYQEYGALTAASKFSAKIPDLDWRQASVAADTTATFVEVPGLQVNELTAHTEYGGRRVAFDFTGSQPQRKLAAAGSLEFRPEDEEIRLERLRFDTQGMTWQTEPGRTPVITYGPNGIGVTDLQLVNGDQRISTAGVFGTTSDKLNVTLDNVDLGVVDAWLLRKPQLSGRVTARAEISGAKDRPDVAADFQIDNGKFRDVAYQAFGGHVKYSGEGADVDVRLQQTASQWLTAKGHVPIAAFTARKQSGDRFDLHVDTSTIDLGLVQGLTPAITRVSGTMQAKFDVTGASDDPRIAGTVTVKDGAFRLEDTGVSYTGLNGRIDLLPDRIHIDDLHVLDNQSQQLTASGDLNVAGLQVGDVNLYFSATDFKVLDNALGNLRLNSDLRLTGTFAHPRIEGELDVSTGSLNLDAILARIGNSPYSTTAAQTAAASVGEGTAETESTWRKPQLSVHVVIPDDLVLKARDLRTSGQMLLGLGSVNLTLGGDLSVNASAGRPMTLVGAVNTVRGFYDFQGRRFQILRDGTVRFEGDPINQLDPALNVVGERVIQAVTARVSVRGRLKQPEIELTSTPPLEPSDILALIVFNQPINQLGAGQQVSLAQRAGVMAAGAVSSELTSSVASSLGLDELEINVAPDPGVAAELVVGHQLSQHLYVKVQQGLGDRSQTNVILEYEFNKWLRLQSNLLQGNSAQQQLFQRVHSTGLDLVFSLTFK